MEFIDGPCSCPTAAIFKHRKSKCSLGIKNSSKIEKAAISSAISATKDSQDSDQCDCSTSSFFPHRRIMCSTKLTLTKIEEVSVPVLDTVHTVVIKPVASAINRGFEEDECDSTTECVVSDAKTSTNSTDMDETRRALLERGVRLEELSDKSARLCQNSSDFATAAKQLNEQQQKSNWFG